MKRLLLIFICLCLLVLPASAEDTQAQITTYNAVCTVADNGSCNVTVTLSVDFPEDATSFLLPLPLEAEQITALGLHMSPTAAEDRILLVLEKPDGFSDEDVICVSYRLPQLAESWDGKQTMTLPLLFDNWNCKISFYQLQLDLPAAFDAEPSIVDADGDRIRNFLTATAEERQLTLESSGRSFTPQSATLEMVFPDGYFSLPDDPSSMTDSDTTQIRSLDAVCTVEKDSSCLVSMTAEYAFSGSTDRIRIPVPKGAYDVSVGGMRFSKRSDRDCTLLTVQNPSGFSGTQELQISYRLLTTAAEADGGQSFFLPLIFPQWDYSIRALSLSLTLPSELTALPEFVSSYYGDQIDNYLDIQTEGEVLSVRSLQPLMEQESLAVRLTLPSDFFDLRFQKARFSVPETVVFWIAAGLCVLYWFFFLRTRRRPILPVARAPLGCNAGQIPYLLRQKSPSFGLMTVTWATLGYLSLKRTDGRKQWLVRRMDMKNERSRCETVLFSALFSRDRDCRVRTHTFQTAAVKCEAFTKADWDSRLLHRRRFGSARTLQLLGLLAACASSFLLFDRLVTPQSFRWLLIVPLALLFSVLSAMPQRLADLHFVRHPWKRRLCTYAIMLILLILGMSGGCLGTVLLNILLQYLIGLALVPGTKRSSDGMDLFYQLLGLRRFLRRLEPSELETLLRNDPQYYYRTLPYAEALGIGGSFTKKFADLRLEPCHWLDWKGQTVEYAEDFYHRFSLMLDEMDADTSDRRHFSVEKLLRKR